MENVYSEISLTTVERFRLARYVVISPNPEEDVMGYMEPVSYTHLDVYKRQLFT